MTRWNRRLLFGAIAVLVPALAGCEAGFDAPTLTFHPAAFGVNASQHGIAIDNAFVLGSPPGSALPSGGQAGVFLSLEAENGDRLVSVSAQGVASSVTIDSGSVNLPAQTLVDLSGPAPKLVLTGLASPISGGQTVQLSFDFAEAGTITLTVPVEPRAYEYATYAPPTIPATSAAAGKKPHASASASTSGPAVSTSVSPSATP